MEKLSTEKLKKLISEWLSTPELKASLRQYHVEDGADQRQIDRYSEYVKGPLGLSADAVRERIWKLWCDGKEWKRVEKHKLGEDWENCFYAGDSLGGTPSGGAEPEFMEDFCGGQNKKLVAKFYADKKVLEKCIYRQFVPGNMLGDAFRLEVVTTPDDTEVIGWCVTAD